MRMRLVESLKQKGIQDEGVLAAIAKIPRHFFIDDAFLEHAYEDKPFSIGQGQTISQPYTVAVQSSLLAIQPKDKVLEIGTGSGYQSCVLLELGAELYSIEYNQKLHQDAVFLLKRMGYQGNFKLGDGSLGWPEHAPFDRILVTAGAPTVPSTLLEQLAIGGCLVIPVGDATTQKMLRITKQADQHFEQEAFGNYSFVPLLGKKGWQK
ncbi:MAG: protein-L-isoaspartate(D-aspartate) O-methyltransferase [Flammeovirgaceae bacterium]